MSPPSFRVAGYESWYASSLGRAYLASLHGVLRPWLLGSVVEKAVDIGCGPGVISGGLFPSHTKLWGIDCSLEMARRARARAQEHGEPWLITVGSVEALPFPDQTFDLAFCVNCLEFVKDRQFCFHEISRVLRPSGTAMLGVLNRRSLWEVTRFLKRPFTARPYYRGRFYRIEELRDHLVGAGLVVEELRAVVHFPPVPPGAILAFYERLDRWGQKLVPRLGGVILARARKPQEPKRTGIARAGKN